MIRASENGGASRGSGRGSIRKSRHRPIIAADGRYNHTHAHRANSAAAANVSDGECGRIEERTRTDLEQYKEAHGKDAIYTWVQ